jgi:hypothetical protein
MRTSAVAEFESGGPGANEAQMADLSPPDAVISLHPDPYAPRAARYCVGTVDRPSPDLRDVVMLLTSELVTRAVMLCENAVEEFVELRVWMPPDLVRVEVRGSRELLCVPPQTHLPQDDLLLVDGLADRWAIDADEHDACIWFEIDRHPDAPGPRSDRDSDEPRRGVEQHGAFASTRRR